MSSLGKSFSPVVAWIVLCTFPGTSASTTVPSESELTPEVVAAVERGLEFLAQQQQRDGSWIGDVGYKLNTEYNVQEQSVPHVGVTALCGLAFLAGGHMPDVGRYGPNLQLCIDYLLDQVNELGFITAHQTRMYSHAFATLFLAEVYGTTHRSDIRPKLQQAVDLIVHAQNDKGSWRYVPFAVESDMSITVCQLMALRAARNIGIKVNASTIDRAVKYVQGSLVTEAPSMLSRHQPFWDPYYDFDVGAFRYQEELDSRSSFALTAAGITSLYHAARYDTNYLRKSLEFMQRKQRDVPRGHYFYYYGHYYAVQAMYISGGEYWSTYWRQISRELLDSQQKDGNWENYCGPGERFATAVALIVLQTPYRYLPILQR